MTKKSKFKTWRWSIITRANNYYRYGRSESVGTKYYPKYDGTAIRHKYVSVYQQKDKAESFVNYTKDLVEDKTLPAQILNKECSWECDQWLYCPNTARIAYILGAEHEFTKDLIYTIENGFPTMTGQWYLNSLCKYGTATQMQKKLPSMYYGLSCQQLFAQCQSFWSSQHNKDLFYKIKRNRDDEETLTINNILDVKFDSWIFNPLPTPQQLWSTAAFKVPTIKYSRKKYVYLCFFSV